MVFLALPCAGSLPPSGCSKAPSICARGSSCRGPGCLSAPSSSRRRVLATGRCAVRPVGVAARRRAPTAVNNGAGREEKGNLLGEAVRPAGGRASDRAREERVHFCPGVRETRPPQARVKEHRGSGSASSEKPGQGSPVVGSERARGARSPRAWPARETTGGAPREGPRSSAGCRTKSYRRCNGPATAVSVRAPANLGAPLSLGRRWGGRGA